jgi:hypothetical protein
MALNKPIWISRFTRQRFSKGQLVGNRSLKAVLQSIDNSANQLGIQSAMRHRLEVRRCHGSRDL